jgi:hypothetical protein
MPPAFETDCPIEMKKSALDSLIADNAPHAWG